MKKFKQMRTKELRDYIRKNPTDAEAIQKRLSSTMEPLETK